jgi:hypothetical protein
MNTRVGITGCVETGPSLGLALVIAMDGGSEATRLVALELLTTLALLNTYRKSSFSYYLLLLFISVLPGKMWCAFVEDIRFSHLTAAR